MLSWVEQNFACCCWDLYFCSSQGKEEEWQQQAPPESKNSMIWLTKAAAAAKKPSNQPSLCAYVYFQIYMSLIYTCYIYISSHSRLPTIESIIIREGQECSRQLYSSEHQSESEVSSVQSFLLPALPVESCLSRIQLATSELRILRGMYSAI